MTADDPALDAAREDLCRFLAACYYEPSPVFVEERLFESLREAAGRIDPGLAESARRVGEAFAAEGADELLVEYTRLFLGPIDAVARPYGSFWLGADRTLMDASTQAVRRLYAEGGFEIAEDFRELPDHLAAELEFLYLLLFRERRAQRAGGGAEADAIAALRRRLLDEHLGAWIGPFASAVRDGTRSGFYRELASLTESFVASCADGKPPRRR